MLRGGVLLGRRRVPVPGEQLVQAAGGVVDNVPQHVGEPSLWIDVVELGSADQRVHRSALRVRAR
jgi:hypothetical protein